MAICTANVCAAHFGCSLVVSIPLSRGYRIVTLTHVIYTFTSISYTVHRSYWCVLPTSQGCFCPRIVFENTELNSLWNTLASWLCPMIGRYHAVVFQTLWLIVVFGAMDKQTTFNLYVGPFFGKSILNKLVCKFDSTQDISFIIMNICIESNYWYALPPKLFSFLYFLYFFSFQLSNSFSIGLSTLYFYFPQTRHYSF